MKRRKKKEIFTKPRKEEDEWEDVKSAIKNIRKDGTKSISRKLLHRLQLMDSEGKHIQAETPDLRDEIDNKLIAQALKKILKSALTMREQVVIESKYFGNLTSKAIAAIFFVTPSRVNQIQQKALRKLRHPKLAAKMARFNIPLAEEWVANYKKKENSITEEDETIPPKPEWVRVEFSEDGLPFLTAPTSHVWWVKPVTHKVYKAWLEEAMEEHEAISQRNAEGEGSPPI